MGISYCRRVHFPVPHDHGSDPIAMGVSYPMDLEKMYAEYIDKYGKEKADFLMETMSQWQTHYDRAVYIDLGLADGTRIENLAKEEATFLSDMQAIFAKQQ